jgi:hypothetical protein
MPTVAGESPPCVCGLPHASHLSVTLPIDTDAAAAGGDAGASHHAGTTQMNTEAVAAAVACNPPIRAFQRPSQLGGPRPTTPLWEAEPRATGSRQASCGTVQALRGTVQALCMGSAARKCSVQSVCVQPTPQQASDGDPDIQFKIVIWPFVVSFIKVLYLSITSLPVYQSQARLFLVSIPSLCLLCMQFCHCLPETKRK